MIRLIVEEYLDEMASVCKSQEYGIMVAVTPDSNRVGVSYFKFLDAPSYGKAKREIRILFNSPDYVYHKDGKKLWKLNSSDKKTLIKILDAESDDFSGYTNWEIAKYMWNREYLEVSLNIEKYFNGEYDDEYKDIQSYVPHDLKRPDYNKLNIK